MIYLRREEELHREVQQEFEVALETILKRMKAIYHKRGRRLDTQTPIHHRMPPTAIVWEIAKKARRLQGTLDHEGWELSLPHLAKVIEESIDVANYALFLAALAKLLQKEMHDEASTD